MKICFLLFLLSLNEINSNCNIKNKSIEIIKRNLEEKYLNTSFSSLNSISMLFGHLHHAGGTAVCELARKNINTNLKNNCNHPNEFRKDILPPTRGTINEQIIFQKTTNWKFYAVEISMPRELIFEGPLIYSIILRHPYLLLLSQYRRLMIKFQFKGSIKDVIQHQLSRFNTSIDLNKIYSTNYYRGIAGFILGKYQETSKSNQDILQEVIQRLERFSIILLTEEMSISGQLFNLKFHWNTTKFGENLVNSHGNLSELLNMAKNFSIEEKRFIEWYCSIDLLIYQYGRCLINEELKKYSNNNVKLLKKLSKELLEIESVFNVNKMIK